jgi:methylisocitrate lyase
VVDIDTGYGGPFNVERTVESLVRYGAAGCFLEDQVWPKRCGHMDGKRVVELDEYLPKLRAALSARGSAPLHVTARTDARAVEGLDAAIARGKACADAGADAVFVEAPESIEELERIGRELAGVTLVANMIEHGKTPLLTPEELSELGFRMIAWPLTGLFAAVAAMRDAYAALATSPTDGPSTPLPTFDEVNTLLGLDARRAQETGWVGRR